MSLILIMSEYISLSFRISF